MTFASPPDPGTAAAPDDDASTPRPDEPAAPGGAGRHRSSARLPGAVALAAIAAGVLALFGLGAVVVPPCSTAATRTVATRDAHR